MTVSYDHVDLPPEQKQRVLEWIRLDRERGELRGEAESGVSAEYALRQFEYACSRFAAVQAGRSAEGRENRKHAKVQLEALLEALCALQKAANAVKSHIGDELYSELPERVFAALVRAYPPDREFQDAATTIADYAPDPLEWRRGRNGGLLLDEASIWAGLAQERVSAVAEAYKAPGRDVGTPMRWLADDMLSLLRLLDRSDVGAVRPVPPKRLAKWVSHAQEIMGLTANARQIGTACKHAIARLGPKAVWEHPSRPSAHRPRVLFHVSVDAEGNRTRLA